MKFEQIKITIEQVAALIEQELGRVSGDDSRGDADWIPGLLDAKEYLRRAYHAIDGTPTEDNDTTIETARYLRAQENFVNDND